MLDLVRLARDPTAAYELLKAAQRRGDADLCMQACDDLVRYGQWKPALEWYTQRVEELWAESRGVYGRVIAIEMQYEVDRLRTDIRWVYERSGQEGVTRRVYDHPRISIGDRMRVHGVRTRPDPVDCHELCNAIRRICHIPQAPPQVFGLWSEASRLWWPDKERGLQRTPACVCTAAGVTHGNCPDNYHESLLQPRCLDGRITVRDGYGDVCPTCNGTGKCPRCGDRDR